MPREPCCTWRLSAVTAYRMENTDGVIPTAQVSYLPASGVRIVMVTYGSMWVADS